jgi:diguanylate cyclase (GGDEF)-like protein
MLSDLDADARTSLAQASAIAEKIRLSLAKPYSLRLSLAGQDSRTVEHHCTSSIGVVLMAPDCGDMESPLKQADAAMYQAKVNGRNRVVFGPSP